jgi:excisionase family DNA binding protein
MSGADYLTLTQAGDEYVAVGSRMLRRWVQRREIPFTRAGNRIILHRDDIERKINEGRVEPPYLRALRRSKEAS